MTRYRKRPVEVDAVQWTGRNFLTVAAFIEEGHGTTEVRVHQAPEAADSYIDIPTLEGVMRAEPGDWIVRGIKGELYPVKPDIFDATYERADAGIPGIA